MEEGAHCVSARFITLSLSQHAIKSTIPSQPWVVVKTGALYSGKTGLILHFSTQSLLGNRGSITVVSELSQLFLPHKELYGREKQGMKPSPSFSGYYALRVNGSLV